MKLKTRKRQKREQKEAVTDKHLRKIIILVLGLILCFMVNVVSANEIHVYSGQNIQAAIGNSYDGDVIIVHSGTYIENIDFSGKTITLKSVDPNDSNIVIATIIDGNQAGSVVTFDNREKNNSILNGFTLKNGKAEKGGGIYCGYDSSPIIMNCIVEKNSAFHQEYQTMANGGGLYCGENVTIINCIFQENSAIGSGGGIYSTGALNIIDSTISENTALHYYGGGINVGGILGGSSLNIANITNCIISKNISSAKGGGIYCNDVNINITNCSILNNTTTTDKGAGGGIYCEYLTSLFASYYFTSKIMDCKIVSNKASNGGGIYCKAYPSSSSHKIRNSSITNNEAINYGGGIHCDTASIECCEIANNLASFGGGVHCESGSLSNCIIVNNLASYGGGINSSVDSSYSASCNIINCTIAKNLATNGGGMNVDDSSVQATNCIIWNNPSQEIHVSVGSSPTITYSDIKIEYPGEGNIKEEPLFIDPNNDNFHLHPNSPCIDAGTTCYKAPTIDKDSLPRPIGAGYDIGAYEYYDPNQHGPLMGDNTSSQGEDNSSDGGGCFLLSLMYN